MGLLTTVLAAPAQARVDIQVDLSSQTMEVSSGEGAYSWPISSAREGFSTPRGSYGVERMEVMHLSRKYHNSPMPHSLFFRGGYAIHGTYATASLGQPASHGCIRIAPENAAALYEMVRAEGATITIRGTPPAYQTVDDRAYAGATYAGRGYAERGYAARGYAVRAGAEQADPYAGDLFQWGDGTPVARRHYQRWMNSPDAY